MNLTKVIATFFGSGLIQPASGTWGSLAALPFAYALHVAGGFPALASATVLVFFVGWWATARHVDLQTDPDPSEIVIDEVVGMWIALWPLSLGLWLADANRTVFPYPGWIGGFLMFRLFDIWKPWPVSWADELHSPLGVMLDDVFAGILAAIVVSVAAYVSHTYLMG